MCFIFLIQSLFKLVTDDIRSIPYVHSHSKLVTPSCDVYMGQTVSDLSECLWGERFLDGFNQD